MPEGAPRAHEGPGGGTGGYPESGLGKKRRLGTWEILPRCLRRPLGGRDTLGWQGGVSWGVLGQGDSPGADCLPTPHTDSFGIRLVPQASEDKFDCYKCHWREGSMCGYGICE